jgi:serine/threonine protein phosphatase PrpC
MSGVESTIIVRADAQNFAPSGFRNLAAAALELGSGRLALVRSSHGEARIEATFSVGSAVVLVLIDGAACSYSGQLHPFGIDSSQLALDALRQALKSRRPPAPGDEGEWLRAAVAEASLRACGTALGSLCASVAVVLMLGRRAWFAHLGDVVVLVCKASSGHELVELTDDHTLYQDLVSKGVSAAELAPSAAVDYRNLLLRSFGWLKHDREGHFDLSHSDPDVGHIDLAAGDVLLVASRLLLAEVAPAVSLAPEIRAANRRRWHELWLAEARRRELRAAGLVLAEVT